MILHEEWEVGSRRTVGSAIQVSVAEVTPIASHHLVVAPVPLVLSQHFASLDSVAPVDPNEVIARNMGYMLLIHARTGLPDTFRATSLMMGTASVPAELSPGVALLEI